MTVQGHFGRTSIVLDEPAVLLLGQAVRVEIEPPTPSPTPAARRPSGFGLAKGMFEMRDDFNDPLDDFADYL